MNNHVTHLHTAPSSSPAAATAEHRPAAAEPATLPGTLPYGEPESGGSGGSDDGAPAGGGGGHPDAVRAAVTAEIAAHGLSQAEAARGMGVSPTTLSRWTRGDYAGANDKVTEAGQSWLDMRTEARERTLAPAGLDRHAGLGVTHEVMAALGHAQATGDVVLIHGRSGAGKSHALSRYAATRAGVYSVTATSGVTSLGGLDGRVARALGAPGRYASALAAEDAILERLDGRQALLAVDEAQHLGARLLDALRGLRDLSGCGLALVGDDTIRMTLARCPQVTGRIGIRVGLGVPPGTDVTALLTAMLGRKPIKSETRAGTDAVAGPGGLHALRRLLARAFLLAHAEGREAIAADDIQAAATAAD